MHGQSFVILAMTGFQAGPNKKVGQKQESPTQKRRETRNSARKSKKKVGITVSIFFRIIFKT